MALLRRRLRCHYCNNQSRDTFLHIPKTFHCPQCDAVNHFDEVHTRCVSPQIFPADLFLAWKHHRSAPGRNRIRTSSLLSTPAVALTNTCHVHSGG